LALDINERGIAVNLVVNSTYSENYEGKFSSMIVQSHYQAEIGNSSAGFGANGYIVNKNVFKVNL